MNSYQLSDGYDTNLPRTYQEMTNDGNQSIIKILN